MAVTVNKAKPVAAANLSRAPGVLQVLPALGAGGVERGTIDVAAALTAAGWRAVVVSSGGPLVREVERAGATHLSLPVESKNPLVMRANIDRLAEVIRAHDIDIVHARSRAPAWSARGAAARCGVHFVTTFHGTYNAGNPLKKTYNAIMTKGERVIAISDFIGEHVVAEYGAERGRVVVIPRGIDLATFDRAAVSAERMIRLAQTWRLDDGVPVVMLPGRLTEWKGQSVMIEAVARLGRHDIRCILVGDDQGRAGYRKRLEEEIARHGLDHVVHIVGHCNDMPAAYMLADVVVSAATAPEAFARTVVEAQAMGRPVVATAHGDAALQAGHGKMAWLVPPGDAAALAEALGQALSLTPSERRTWGPHAIALARARLSQHLLRRQTLQVYDELLRAGPAARHRDDPALASSP
jgi:glycosyltransferase involved in cell wall biosynthesis